MVKSFQQVFRAVHLTALGEPHPPDETTREWPQDLQEVYKVQMNIGWDQILYGRLVKPWEHLALYNSSMGIGMSVQ